MFSCDFLKNNKHIFADVIKKKLITLLAKMYFLELKSGAVTLQNVKQYPTSISKH